MDTLHKKSICLLLLCVLCGFWVHPIVGKTMNERPIHFIPPGGWGGGGNDVKSMAMPSAVSASIEGSLLHIQCAHPTVDVTVRIIQNGVVIHEAFILASDTKHIWINLSGHEDGVYTLDLSNSAGGHVYGDFSLNT